MTMYIVINRDEYFDNYILYASLDKNKAKEYVVSYLKKEHEKYKKKQIESLERCNKEYNILTSQIEANEKLSYYGCKELLQKLNRDWFNLSNQISYLESSLKEDCEKDFDILCDKYEICIKEVELDKDVDICVSRVF